MTTKTARNEKAPCGLCGKLVDVDQYRLHVKTCGNESDEEPQTSLKECPFCHKRVKDLSRHCETCSAQNGHSDHTSTNRHSSPKSSVRTAAQSRNTKSTRRMDKECPTCFEMIDEYDLAAHIIDCNGKSSRKPQTRTRATKQCPTCSERFDEDEFEDHIDRCDRRPSRRPPVRTPVMKQCPTCSERFDEYEFEDHIDRCDRRPSRRPPVRTPVMKQCPTCSERFDEYEFEDHIDRCDRKPSRRPPVRTPVMKQCPTCSERFDEYKFEDHIERCDGRRSRKPPVQRRLIKKCPTCSEMLDENEFADHIDQCDRRSLRRPPARTPVAKQCPTCSERFDEYEFEDHIERCNGGRSRRTPVNREPTSRRCPTCTGTFGEYDYQYHVDQCQRRSIQTSTPNNNREECPVCLKTIDRKDFLKHVNACADNLSAGKSANTSVKKPQKTCFNCSTPVDESSKTSHTIPCRTRHIYCIKCLERSMNEFIQSNTAPVCHAAFCDHELSLYDIECLPIQADLRRRVLPLVKNTQRPQCPTCLFYVEFKTMDDLTRHVMSCTPENTAECDFCHCLYHKNRLIDHTRQCRNDTRAQQQQALIDFILPRVKYPITPQQLRIFLDYRRSNRLPGDLRALITALADFGGTFPFDVPTRTCDICTDAYVYDDIFVFGCEQSHKLCYTCFAESCAAKKNANEILTCAMCAYQLIDGEIKQLRVPADQKRELVDYQTQKTFSSYSGGTQGVIRCPHQGCKWVAEAQNPDDRFEVECLLCGNKFCSLCNQQYHFRTTCQQIPEITQRWFFWCNTERGNYWQARAQQDANFQAQLEDFQRQRVANEQRNQELRQRYDELVADEQYKAQNCRSCPHCGRVVQHLGGCDSMICGQNYHGGDQQSGCGQRFNWSQATRYASIGNTGPQQVATDMPAPEQQKAVVHTGVECDSCHNEIQGIRFDCVHCSSLIYCERCEQRATLDHSNEIRAENKPQHVFRLITQPL